jgi:Flp pilus assembly protein TadB
VIALLLLAGAVGAFSAARTAAGRDRALNPRERASAPSPSVRLLCSLGRVPARRLEARLPRLARGWLLGLVSVPAPADVDTAALRAGAAIAFVGLAAAALVVLGGVTGVGAALVLAGFGGAYPELWLRATAARRAERIERRVPELVELVASMVAAGVGSISRCGARGRRSAASSAASSNACTPTWPSGGRGRKSFAIWRCAPARRRWRSSR